MDASSLFVKSSICFSALSTIILLLVNFFNIIQYLVFSGVLVDFTTLVHCYVAFFIDTFYIQLFLLIKIINLAGNAPKLFEINSKCY